MNSMDSTKMIDICNISNALEESIKKLGTDSDVILVVYLFGSVLKKKLEPASDVDFAFLLKTKEYIHDPIQSSYPAYRVASDIGLKFNKKTDVTILNSSSLEIAYEVITTGRCIYEYDMNIRFEYEAKIRGMYLDFKPFLMDLRARTIEQIIKGSSH